MRLDLTWEERIVIKCLQKEGYPLTATSIANITGLGNYEVMNAIVSLAEKELIFAEDKTVAELSPFGETYNLFDDASIDRVSGEIPPETEILLKYFLKDPNATVSLKSLITFDGLKSEKIEEAIDELERLGYPVRSRIKP